MKRSMIILLAVLGLAIIGGGAWLMMNRDTLTNPLAQQNQNTNTATTNTTIVNASSENLNVSLPNEIQGEQPLDATVSVGGTEVHFSSVSKVESFEAENAPTGKTFVVVYFDPVTSDKIPAIDQGFSAGVNLATNKGDVEPLTTKIASTSIKNAKGYLKFLVDATATTFSLEITGASGITLPL